MRTLLLTLTMFMLVSFGFAQDSKQGGPEINFDKLVHDFGKIMQGDKAEYDFKFTNTGNEPLIISDVRSSCGCTVPEWPKSPILPGTSSSIKVKYNSNNVGLINKQVTIISNSVNSPTVLRIAGNVEKMPSEIMPFQQQTAVPASTTNKK